MERFVDEGLVLSTVDYGDADRIVTLFTLNHGRLSAFAAGARKSKRRFAGALEAGTHLKAQLVSRGSDVLRLDGVDVVKSFHRLRDELPLIARALYCLELCRELTRDQEPHAALFEALRDYLGLLEDKKAGPTSLIKFELDALALTGFMPRFTACVVCGGETGPQPRFDPQQGGIACVGCGPRMPMGVYVAPAVVDGLAQLQLGARVPMPADLRKRARELLNAFIAHQLGRALKSAEFMEQVGTD